MRVTIFPVVIFDQETIRVLQQKATHYALLIISFSFIQPAFIFPFHYCNRISLWIIIVRGLDINRIIIINHRNNHHILQPILLNDGKIPSIRSDVQCRILLFPLLGIEMFHIENISTKNFP